MPMPDRTLQLCCCCCCAVLFRLRLLRLVKLWAAAHDVNDAARSTFNSTSLLYLTAFFLQKRQLVPPLQELVEPALLNDPTRRLLCETNKCVWHKPGCGLAPCRLRG